MTQSSIQFIEDPTCRELYVDSLQISGGPPGILRFQFGVARLTADTPPRPLHIVPSTRIAMPFAVAIALRDALNKVIDSSSHQTLSIPLPPVVPPTRQ